jgi:hypothetical protein
MSERLGQLDIVFAVDNTGSMGPYIENVKLKILEIIRTIKKEELCRRLRVGLVSYRDHPPEESSYVAMKYELSDDTAKIEDYVKKMAASGGGDGPEAVCDAMNLANRMEFHNESAKVIVLIGDAPPHGVEPDGDSFPKGCPDGHNWKKEAKKAFDKGIVYHTVGCYPEITNYQKAVETYEKIAELSKGKFIPLTQAELLVKVITGVALEEIDKIAIQQSILEDLGVDMDDLTEEDLTEDKLQELTEKAMARGMKKRAVRHRAASAPSAAPGSARAEAVEMEEVAVDEEDVKEALRQLKSKVKK